MTRLVRAAALYAVFVALVVAAPLAASGETDAPPLPPEPTVPVEPAADPAAPAEPAPLPAPTEQLPAAPPAEPQPVPAAPAEPAPAPPPPPSALEPAVEQEVASAQVAKRTKAKARKRVKARAAASATVTISDFQFAPATVTVNVGDTVTWNNAGPTAHSATASDGGFDTGIFSEGQSRSATFDQAGTFAYICTPHPQMEGTVVVRAAAAGGSQEGSSGTDDGTAGDGAGTSGADAGPTLPATGLDTSGLILVGLATLGLGAYLRRTTG